MRGAYPEALERLIDAFKRHPGVGPKSAERLAFFSLSRPREEVEAFAGALTEAMERVRPCGTCFRLVDADGAPPEPREGLCGRCEDPRRDAARLCVVENPRDVFAFERSGVWTGYYHVLEGLISPLDGVGPEDIRVDELLARVAEGPFEEVVLALNPSTEGESTSIYLSGLLADSGARVTRIAYGLPVGGELEFADPVTLQRALEGRKAL